MRSLPPGARAYILCASLAAAVCVTPAVLPGADTPWSTTLPLAALCAVVAAGPAVECGGPLLLAGAMLLPPPAAALIALPAGLASRVERPPVAARRCWRAAQLPLATAAASGAFALSGGRTALASLDLPFAALPATAAALVFQVVRTALEAGVLATAERYPPRDAWGTPPARCLAPCLLHAPAGLAVALLWHSPYGPVAAVLVLLPLSVSTALFALCPKNADGHQIAVRSLVQAIGLKDRYTRGHSERVGRASVMIARELGMTGEQQEALRIAGTLHDVGKIGIPTRLLRKDGRLTPEELRTIRLHPEYGHEMVRGIGCLAEARAAILHHHERLDGTGYPYGLKGRDIPECARVVAVADAFDAMTSHRSYRRARPVPRAVEELRRCAGTQFDPAMVRALAAAVEREGWETARTADGPPPRSTADGAPGGCGNVPPTPAGAVPGHHGDPAPAASGDRRPAPPGDRPPAPARNRPPSPGGVR